ncbi:unnamed protein product [Porites evermanni]|uniref:DNA-directed RNA polymerase III subunit RPC4 n=1 Tax=Porites evermanni TaxID=104178 RepID=A0ABN8PVR7_9CNID|nr:unnamed protein product [Porites evermanni]
MFSFSPGRLPSLRPARDLTLGAASGITPAKRTFTPNIPTRRIKQESFSDRYISHQRSGGQRQQRGEGRGRGRGEGRGRGRGERNKPTIVQSSSIFSMGVGPVEKQRVGSSIPSYGSSSGGGGSVSSFTVKKESADGDNDEESKRVLKMLQTSGDIEDDDMENETGIMPVQLPFSHIRDFRFLFVRLRRMKSEPMDIDLVDAEQVKSAETIKKPIKQEAVKKELIDKKTLSNLLSAQSLTGEQLLFFQFPDVLPIKTDESPMPVDTDASAEQTASEEKPKEQKKLSLKDASEGYIGKLQLLRSGKARLLLGDVSLDVTTGTPCGFLQDVVSVHTEDNRSEMICLGHVKHRMICAPDFEHLLAAS